MKKTIIAITSIISVFILTTFVVSLFIINGDTFLKSFNIISISNVSTKYIIKFEKIKAAKYYDVIIYNSDDTIFYKEETTNNNLILELNNIVYDNEYRLVIYAYNELGESIEVNNPYTFTYNEPTFNKNNTLLLTNNEDYNLLIDGDLTKKTYYISINDGDYTIKKERLTTNEYTISKDLFTGLKQVLTVDIYDNNNIINTLDLYSNLSPVKDIKITSPSKETLDYEDINLTYEGGENASEYKLLIYNNNKLLKESTITQKSIIISSDFFKKGEKYKIEINALYEDKIEYMKSSYIEFNISSKDTLKPAYININPNYVKRNSVLTLNNPNSSGNIYYTIDGTDPDENSILYTEKIEVKENMTIKAIIKDKTKNDSKTSKFKVTIADKPDYKVYLSISDSLEIQDICNDIENNLKAHNVIVYRNDLNSSVNTWLSDAKSIGSDLYLGIHTNYSSNSENYGIETWINNEQSKAYSLANIIHNDLVSIYNRENGNRGLKYSRNTLEELNSNLIPLNLILYLGYQDNEADEKWLSENRKEIASSISNSVLKYFGII